MAFRLLISTVIAVTLFGAPTALANDESLYADTPPKDASFVRFIGFDADASAPFAGKDFELREEDKAAYVPVSAAKLENIDAGLFYTVVKQTGGRIVVISERHRDDVSKVYLVLVNASGQVLDLKLADGSVAVISDVAAMSSELRPVNPVKIALGVFAHDGATPLARFDVALRRGQNITFYADDTGVRLIENRFGLNAK